MKEKLNKLKRFNIHGNGFVNDPNGKMVMFSQIAELLRDETAGANVIVHDNYNPDGNESDKYTCITSDKFNICLTDNQVADAKKRYEDKPWLPKVQNTSPPKAKKASKDKVGIPIDEKGKNGSEKVPKTES